MSFHGLSKTDGGAAFMTLLLTTLTLTAFVPAPATADSCANAAQRFGASANLPDCRAYELVTPMIKEDNNFILDVRAFPDGQHLNLESLLPFPGSQNGEWTHALSARTGSGWVTTALTPPQGPGQPDSAYSPDNGEIQQPVSFASGFSAAFVNSPFASDPLDQEQGWDVYRVSIPSGASSLASLPDSGAMTEALINPPGINVGFGVGSYLAGNSADGSRVFFETTALLPTAPGTPVDTHSSSDELYERYAGHTYLVGVLPDGSAPSCGAEIANGGTNALNNQSQDDNGAVAADGSNVVFRAPGFQSSCDPQNLGLGRALYLRENNGTSRATTVTLPGSKLAARSADGSKLFTTDFANGTASIYEYDIPTGQSIVVGHGEAVAFSADGSRVYYLAGRAISKPQLYLYEGGVSKSILGENAAAGYTGFVRQAESNLISGEYDISSATPDGSKLLFLDRASLTSYDTSDPACAARNRSESRESTECTEAYVYDAENGSVTCVSCNPNGTPPAANVYFGLSQASNVLSPFVSPEIQTLSVDGSRAIFETKEGLVAQDTNGVGDVYEWENGHIYLLSSGQGSDGSRLVGTSSDGNNVFFVSTDRLVPQDVENSQQVYDARVGGGFPYAPPGHGCDSGQCQGPQTIAPVFAAPPSATFVGVGNPVREVKPVQTRKTVRPKHVRPHKHKAKRARAKGRADNSKRKGRK